MPFKISWGWLLLLVLVIIIYVGYKTTDKSYKGEPSNVASKQIAQDQPEVLYSTPGPPEEPPDKWKLSYGKSEMDDSPSVTLNLEAENEITGWLDRYTPVLVIRCREHKTDIIVVAGMSANPEYGLFHEFTVRVRLDEGQPFKQRWSDSTDNKALFAPRPIELARKIVNAKKMIFEFIPFNASPQTVTFDIRRLNKYLPEIAKTCKWKI